MFNSKGRTLILLLVFLLSIMPVTVLAGVSTPPQDLIPYDEIGPRLAEIAAESSRVKVEVIGQSAAGRDMYLVTVADSQAMGKLDHYKALRKMMIRNPEQAQEMIERFDDFRVPFFINGSIHGDEYEGVDAAIRLIETLAFDDSEEAQVILDNVFLLVNVVANPDGRVLGQRRNSNNFDLNRDFITQSQPETVAMAGLIAEWNPMVLLDLHGYVNPMLIEPCTPPHNPNVEYDIYIKWALDQAEAMEAELLLQTGRIAYIPFRDSAEGWDDWAPIYTPMYAMYHGSYAHTLETPVHGEGGVAAHYSAVWGALKFAAENRKEMIWDQIEIFKRGFLDMDQVPISNEILDETPFDQYPEMTTIDFPAAYLIPAEEPLQMSPHQAARLVNFLRFNDVQVSQANQPFTWEGTDYPAGTYVVWMNQPKRGLANTILWDGLDISYDPGLDMYDISSWSHAPLWGVTRQVVKQDLEIATTLLRRDATVAGGVETDPAPAAYAFLPTSNQVILATNALLDQGVSLGRAELPFEDDGVLFGTGTLVIPPDIGLAEELAQTYGLELAALSEHEPSDFKTLSAPKILVSGDEGIVWFLDTYDFDYTVISSSDLAGDNLAEYDVLLVQSALVNGSSQAGTTALERFFAGGGDLVGIGSAGASLSTQVGVAPNLIYFSRSGNGIVQVDYDSDDVISAQYPADDYAFVYGPTWFTELPKNWQVSATLEENDFFLSGFWSGWKESDANGQAIVIHGQQSDSAITLIGFDPTFRAHPEQTYRILANALYSWVD